MGPDPPPGWWTAPPLETGVPPATLLRLPPAMRTDTARGVRAAATPPRARTRDWRHRGVRVDTAADQLGYVKLWRARAVDLRRALAMARRAMLAAAAAANAAEEGQSTAKPGRGAEKRAGYSPAEILARRLLVLLQPPPEALLRASGPLTWPAPFYAYQRDGVQALLRSTHLLLGDDMGLGKSIQCIAALRLLLHRHEIERALVVAPAGLLEQWRRELEKWAPELRVMVVYGSPEDRLWQWQYRAHVTLTSYETLRADSGGPSSGPRREPWGAVVLDEAQRIKNRDADVARACKRLPRERSWALTGTPLENRYEDLVSILEFVAGHDRRSLALTPGPALRTALSELQLRRRKADVLRDLPPKIVSDIVLPLSPSQRQAYQRAEQEEMGALRNEREVRIENVLALITRLKQICNFAPEDGASPKLDDLADRLEQLTEEGHRALVFTQFTDRQAGARRIAEALARFAPLVYTGDMDVRERARIVDRFRDDDRHKVLILSLRAGGQGLNLQAASYVFHFDRWWNPAIERQAEDRTHRLGQSQPVHVYRYLMADTVEQRVDAVLKEKADLFENLVDGTTLDVTQLLDKRDLFQIVGLEPPGSAPSDGIALEKWVADLLERRGYATRRTGRARDGGIDVVAEKSDLSGARVRLYIQCKDTSRPVGVEAVRSLNGVLPADDRGAIGVLVCPFGFSPEAQAFAAARHIQLWDAARLGELDAE